MNSRYALAWSRRQSDEPLSRRPTRHCAQNARRTTNARRARPDNMCSLRSVVKSVRASFLSAQKFGTRTRGRPLLSNAGRRARTPTLRPGRSLTRPCPGTGTPSLVIERRGRRAFRYSARDSTRLDARTSRLQSTRLYARTFSCALSASQPRPCGARLGTRASRSQRASSLPPAFRASPPAGTVFRRAVRPASRRRRQSVLERQIRPASVRCAHHRGTDCRGVGLTRRPEPARPLRSVSRFAGFATTPLHSRHSSVARQAEASLREHGIGCRPRSAGSEFGGECLLRRLTPQSAAPATRTNRRRLRGLAHAPSLRLRCSCGRVWASARDMRQPRRLPPGAGLTPSVSVRFTPLRCAAAATSMLARWLAASLRSVPLPEAGGDRPGEHDARCARPLPRVVLRQTSRGPRPRCNRIRSVRRDGMKARPIATVLARPSLRACALALLIFSATRAIMFTLAPAPAPAAQDPRCQVPAASRRPRQAIRRPD